MSKEHPLRAYRRERGISMAALAKIADTSETTVSRLERREHNAPLDLLVRLSRATDGAVSIGDLAAASVMDAA